MKAKLEYLQALREYDNARRDRLFARVSQLPTLERLGDAAVLEAEAKLSAARRAFAEEQAATRKRARAALKA